MTKIKLWLVSGLFLALSMVIISCESSSSSAGNNGSSSSSGDDGGSSSSGDDGGSADSMSAYVGNWLGTWENTTFGSSGALSLAIVQKSGSTYEVTVDVHVAKTSSSNTIIEVVALFNGAQVAGSQTGGFAISNNVPTHCARTFKIDGVATQVLKFQMAGGTTNAVSVPLGGNATVSPSISVSIRKL